MMKITGLSHLFKRENLHNWWLTKYFFAPLYVWVLTANLITGGLVGTTHEDSSNISFCV